MDLSKNEFRNIVLGGKQMFVCSDGRIFYNGTEKRQFKNDGGYYKIGFFKKSYYVHRLVAIAFLPNENNKPTVNHKDGDKSNNHVSNLEWNTYAENNEHGRANGLLKPPPTESMKGRKGDLNHLGKSVYRKFNGTIIRYGSIRNAEELTGIRRYTIYKSLKNKQGEWSYDEA